MARPGFERIPGDEADSPVPSRRTKSVENPCTPTGLGLLESVDSYGSLQSLPAASNSSVTFTAGNRAVDLGSSPRAQPGAEWLRVSLALALMGSGLFLMVRGVADDWVDLFATWAKAHERAVRVPPQDLDI